MYALGKHFYRFHVGTFGGTTSQLIYLKNPGNLSPDESSWKHWKETVLLEGGPDVSFEMVVLNDSEGNEYSVLVAGRPVWELSQIFMTS
jgi:hypothetical protein